MPELPEVETVVRGLRPKLLGRVIQACVTVSPLMVGKAASDFRLKLGGRSFEQIDRHGKWIFVRLSGDLTLAIHLGMTGNLRVEDAMHGIEPHTHLRLSLESGRQECRFIDPRRFGELVLATSSDMPTRFGPKQLGKDALLITLPELKETLARTKRRVKSVLLDQRALAGIGNIYADEILFHAGIYPGARADRLADEVVEKLARTITRILKRAINAGGSTIRDYVDSDGKRGSYQNQHDVYGRADQPCRRCGQAVELDQKIVTGRSTHFCSGCQTAGGPKRRLNRRSNHRPNGQAATNPRRNDR
ncbi:bifunctional DNA-formamidopyrimidine glycosylase/DNA-(apurinic or apyrimidinic site) lyase [bacterium]|nr:bifunctional DNA-formamidopyrimidine glycosylase/DNA-(apurinic or apyrimidinic site) lyase [bacterium]